MATGHKRMLTFASIVGIVFVLSGLLFLIKGKGALAASQISVGTVFLAVGAAAARKAAATNDGTGSQPPAGSGSDRA